MNKSLIFCSSPRSIIVLLIVALAGITTACAWPAADLETAEAAQSLPASATAITDEPEPDTPLPPTSLPDTPVPIVEAVNVSDESAQIDYGPSTACLDCHLDQQRLMDTADPVVVVETENEGEG
jgi:hypothetical protein